MNDLESLRRQLRDLESVEAERKRTAEALARERAQILSLFDSIDAVVYVTDPHTHEILFVNRYFRDLLGRDPVGGICYAEFQGKSSPCEFCTNHAILADRERPVRWDFHNRRMDKHFMIVDRIIRWPDGRDVRFELAIDITDRKRAEQEREQHILRVKRQQALIVELSAHDAMVAGRLAEALRVITEGVSEALKTERAGVWLFSEDRKELRCADLFDRATDTHAADVVLPVHRHPAYFQAVASGRAIDADDARADPRTRELLAGYLEPLGITSMLDAGVRVSGRLVGVVCCEHRGERRKWRTDEVTFAGGIADQVAQLLVNAEHRAAGATLRESEKRLQDILNSVQAGIVVIEEDTRTIVDANPAALALLGGRKERILSRPCRELVCRRPAGACPVQGPGREVSNSEEVLIRLDGTPVSILKTVVPITLNGRPHLLVSFIDITDRKRAEEETARKARELAEAKRRLEILVSDTTSRESRLVELKQEVNDLLAAQGKPPRYQAPRQVRELKMRGSGTGDP